jgi:hypothetical protein
MTLPGQMELDTVIDHKHVRMLAESYLVPPTKIYEPEDTHKPAGVRLAKMLSQYDDSPSSQLWSDIQRLAREILK